MPSLYDCLKDETRIIRMWLFHSYVLGMWYMLSKGELSLFLDLSREE